VSERVWLRMYKTEALAVQGGRCAYCYSELRRIKATADHVVARASGGQTKGNNIKAACGECNRLKGSMGERAFVRLIKNPEPGDGLGVWMAWSRRRIALASVRACTAIMAAVT
jgi:5-methylcytosine-specific restriction endonuclease McrA